MEYGELESRQAYWWLDNDVRPRCQGCGRLVDENDEYCVQCEANEEEAIIVLAERKMK